MSQSETDVQSYLDTHKIQGVVEDAINSVSFVNGRMLGAPMTLTASFLN